MMRNVSRRTFGQALVEAPFANKIAAVIVCAAVTFLAGPGQAAAPDPFLAANGLAIRNGHGSGDVVPLRGVNLGGWLTMEAWMVPMDSSGNLPDNYSAILTLDNRFGVTIEQSLIRTFQRNWITTNDLDNIKAMGMNVVRLPVWWADFETLGGTWRADAFDRVDWLVTNAWQRGLYTIIDVHGVPGGQSADQSTGQVNLNQYWTSTADQNQTVVIWQNIATHFAGNPGVAGYDLMNEPQGAADSAAVWSAYNSLYQAIRAIDPDHIIFMEGTFGSWTWSMLPDPGLYGWSNVVYELHEYQWNSTGDSNGVKAGIDNQVSDFKNHQLWNVPAFIGEFNEFSPGSDPLSVWKYAVQQFDTNNVNWTVWSYKTIDGGVPDNWGLYDPIGTWPPKPNLQTSSANTISNNWSQWSTPAAFGINPILQQALGAPIAVADSYTATGGVTLAVNSGSGVLANDSDINLGQPGIHLSTVLVSNPTHGLLTLNADGSFSYTANADFGGTDTFRYGVFDGYVGSVNFATVSIQVSAFALTPYQQWQTLYFTTTNNPAGAPDVDADGDGQSNQQEFLAGSDPTNSASSFRITSILPAGNDARITWMCGGGRTNVLQVATGIGTYSNISPNIVMPGTNVTTTNYTDASALSPLTGAASDNASDPVYASGNLNGANGGSGFGAWVSSPSGNTATAGWFVGSSTNNGFLPSGGIDDGGKSWGAYANSNATASAVRPFASGNLVTGQTFSVNMDNGWVEAGDSVGFDLQNSSGQTLLEISYVGFNAASSYGSTDGTGPHSLGVPYTDGGVHVEITLTSATTYSATMTPVGGSTVSFSGTLINPAGGQGISQVRLFNANAAAGNSGSHWYAFWNNLLVSGVPNAPTRVYRVQLVP